MDQELEDFFNEKFRFQPDKDWVLPSVETLFKEPIWKIENFISLKKKLNTVKSKLNDKDEKWHKHTAEMNKAGLVFNHIKRFFNPEFVTNAWCKFYEILGTFPLLTDTEEFLSLHLCEAPGAFISALNYYLCLNYPKLNWIWFANTLNPYYEGHLLQKVVVDDRLIFQTLDNWIFGKENTGDAMSSNFVKDLSEFMASQGQVNLVTADGSFDCSADPGEQECLVFDLNFSEILACLHVLAPGGNFIIKIFTCYECATICTMYLLNCLFNEVHVFKPVTSRAGNSEVYVICLGFREINSCFLDILVKHKNTKDFSLFSTSVIPLSFMDQLEKCNQFFTDCQIAAIEENLLLFNSIQHEKRRHLDEIRDACVSTYIQKYSLQPLPANKYQKLFRLKRCIKTAQGVKYGDKKLLYLKSRGVTFDNIEQRKYMSREELLSDLESRVNDCFPLTSKRSASNVPAWTPVWREIRFNMKKKSYENWIKTGRTVSHIQNSKFGNPTILTLLNEMTLDENVLAENHSLSSHMYWNWEELTDLVNESRIVFTEVVIHISANVACESFVAKGISFILRNSVVRNVEAESFVGNQDSNCAKLIVIDQSSWGAPTFEQELKYKSEFAKVVLHAIKALRVGDSIALHIQCVLTRFLAGILFMLLSLFAEVAVLLPKFDASAMCGQIWILSNYLHLEHANRVSEHLESLLSNMTNLGLQSVLEVVPITAICSGHFYDYLLDLNDQSMLQRLRKLITVEKRRIAEQNNSSKD